MTGNVEKREFNEIEKTILSNLLEAIEKGDIKTDGFKADMFLIQRYGLVDVADEVDRALVEQVNKIAWKGRDNEELDTNEQPPVANRILREKKYEFANLIDNSALKKEILDQLDVEYYVSFWDGYDYNQSLIRTSPEKGDLRIVYDYKRKLLSISNEEVRKKVSEEVIDGFMEYLESVSNKLNLNELAEIRTIEFVSKDERLENIIYNKLKDFWNAYDFKKYPASADQIFIDIKASFQNSSDETKLEIRDLIEEKYLNYVYENIGESFFGITNTVHYLENCSLDFSEEFYFEAKKYLKDFILYQEKNRGDILVDSTSCYNNYQKEIKTLLGYAEDDPSWVLGDRKEQLCYDLLHYKNMANDLVNVFLKKGEYSDETKNGINDVLVNEFDKNTASRIKEILEENDRKNNSGELSKTSLDILNALDTNYGGSEKSRKEINEILAKHLVTPVMDGTRVEKQFYDLDLFIELIQNQGENALVDVMEILDSKIKKEEYDAMKLIEKNNEEKGMKTKVFEHKYLYKSDVLDKAYDEAEEKNLASSENVVNIKKSEGKEIQ